MFDDVIEAFVSREITSFEIMLIFQGPTVLVPLVASVGFTIGWLGNDVTIEVDS